jgi:spore coat-associated protein N
MKKTRRKILILSLVVLLLCVAVGVTTWAYFSNTGQSTENAFSAGTLNLKLTDSSETDQDNVTASFGGSVLKPGDTVGPSTITLKNVGDLTASHVDFAIDTLATDNATYNATDLGANIADMSTVMLVSALSYDGTSLLTQTTPGTFDNAVIQAADVAGNNNDAITLNELKGVKIESLSAPAANSGSTKVFSITVGIPSGTGNGIQGDVVDVTVTFGLYQNASQHL